MNSRTLGMCVVLWWSSVAFCAPGPADLAAHKEAVARLVQLIEGAQEKRQVSLLKTPEAVRLIKDVSDIAGVLRPGSYTPAEIGPLIHTCGGANKASVALLLFGLTGQTSQPVPKAQAKAVMAALIDRNSVVFQDELKLLQPFLLRCMAKAIQPLTAFTSSLKPAELTDVRRQGIAQMRSGLLQVYTGVVQMVFESRYREDFKAALFEALAETSEHFSAVMQLPERQLMRDSIMAAAGHASGADQVYLTRLARALSSETCEGLCVVR